MTSSASNRRGSALLIVLGMLAFMVVSAVAFSAYMRSSRVPSSFLRRTVASRLLVKAALAEAIEEIDAAVGNNPHPNVGTLASTLPREPTQSGFPRQTTHNRNVWKGRVYIGTNETARIEPMETVPTLTLEGLAYVPPPLVSEARYYSRRSEAAKWHSLSYEAGRYAFTAIDVSDYFDVNAVLADVARSSDPGRKISLAHMFENAAHTSASGSLGSPANWDSFIEQHFIGDGKVPLISMADWNLAIHRNGPSGWTSPFCTFVENGSSLFYNGASNDRLEELRRMTFVTDGWFPSSYGADVLDLANEQNQPFDRSAAAGNLNIMNVASYVQGRLPRLTERLPWVGLISLYDYLDQDRVPLSLGLPTVERVPMISGIGVSCSGATLKIREEAPDDTYQYATGPSDMTRQAHRVRTYTLDPSCLGTMPAVKVVVTYPFHHADDVPASSFSVDGAMVLFLTTGAMGLRPENAVNRLKFSDTSLFSGSPTIGDGVIVLPFSPQSLSFNKVDTWQDAVKDSIAFTVRPGDIASMLMERNNALLHVEWDWQQTDNSDRSNGQLPWSTPSKPEPDNQNDVQMATCGLPALAANGAIDNVFANQGSALVNSLATANPTLTLNVAIVLRVTLNGKTVDMVPACWENDQLNGHNWGAQGKVILGNYFGKSTPLMRLNTGASVSFNVNDMTAAKAGVPVTLNPSGLMVDDPRYNYAPESWVAQAGGIDKTIWHDTFISAKQNDGDIFMSVSDQGYLQSVYELANLPRCNLDGFHAMADQICGNVRNPNTWTETSFVTARDQALNADLMWQTFDPFGRYYGGGDGFELFRLVSDGGATKVNPYSDSTNVLMAALANTPHDWRCASTNNQEQAFENMSASQFNAKYAWNEYSQGRKLAWPDLVDFAGRFMAKMRSPGEVNIGEETWEAALRNLHWFQDGAAEPGANLLFAETIGAQSFPDLQLTQADDLYNVDKKFLYGFWHDCFAAKQQLYLVFVRAEPAMMGSGSARLTSPQMGARAVALVWRDPARTSTNKDPHRTRVLFYRQLD